MTREQAIYVCDYCKNEKLHKRNDVTYDGWIYIRGATITVNNPNLIGITIGELDFCCEYCLSEWVCEQRIYEENDAKSNKIEG
jgi:hypothetical protein